MYKQYPLITLILLSLLGACSRNDGDFKLPGVYRISVQQGNVIEQEMIDRLKPGMERNQVQFIMGTPTLIDPFHPNRWDYIYTYTEGASQRKQRRLTIYFEDDKLAYLDGNIVTGVRKPPDTIKSRSKIVDVPVWQQNKSSFLGNIIRKLPFIGKDTSAPPKVDDDSAKTAQSEQESTPSIEKETEINNSEGTEKEEKGFFSRMLDKLPFVGDDDDETPAESLE